jgi:hypothetical protein
MGIVQTPCKLSTNNTLLLNGRIQEFSATKELIRQLDFGVEGTIISRKDWTFQRTLTSTCSSATFVVPDTSQFYCPTTVPSALLTTMNSTDGADGSQNFPQPNFIYIRTDSPVKVTLGYTANTTTLFRSPTDYTALAIQPDNLNMTVLVNGYFVYTTNRQVKVAPATTADLTVWTPNAGGAWDGSSDSGIIFPIKVDKSINIDQSHITIYCAYMTTNTNSCRSC